MQTLKGGPDGLAQVGGGCEMVHSVLIDEEYSDLSAHVEENIHRKIAISEYIDFSRLIPSDRSTDDEEQRMELVNRDGISKWIPARNKDATMINSFTRWEQAFRVLSNIYTEFFPNKAKELIQYNHIINIASQSFAWDNVYRYDKDFRRHISKHPTRSWGIILEQAWTMRLKDRMGDKALKGSGADRNRARRDICWKFNMGKCTYGLGCKFDHRCALCLKFGHGAHNCRRANRGPPTYYDDRKTGERSHSGFNRGYYRQNDQSDRGGHNRNDRYHFHKKDKDRDGNKGKK